jgi:hypothetical protein
MDEFSWNLIFEIFRKYDKNIQFSLKSDKNNGYSIWRPIHIFISCLISIKLETFQTKLWRKSKHILCSITFCFFENCAVYETMWKNVVLPNRPQRTMWRTGIVYWIPKTKNMPSKYIILLVFPLKQWLDERATNLGYRYNVSPLVNIVTCCGKLYVSENV